MRCEIILVSIFTVH